MVDRQAHNGIRHDDIAISRLRDWINANDEFVSESE